MTGEFDQDYFQELVGQIRSHPNLEYKGNLNQLEDKLKNTVEKVDTLESEDYRFEHVDADGVLTLQMPGYGDTEYAAEGTLGQALPGIHESDPRDGSFTDKLAEAHGEISSQYQDQDYIHRQEHPIDILCLDIPFNYNQEELDQALETVDQAARDVQTLHDEIYDTLEDPTQ